MKRQQALGRRYLAGLVMAFAILFLIVGTLGPGHHSPFFWLIVPPPALVAFALAWRGWSSDGERSTLFSTAGIALLTIVLVFSHLLPRSAG